tara:strand:- start:2268 stop:2702 length:435 start_codon:yes stop_codon:yes gene_type:complete
MEVKDVQPNQGNIELVLTIKDKGEARTFEKFGKTGKVCSATAKDDSGEIKLTLWNDDVDKVKAGDKIHLKNGWCSEYQGERQLSSGKFGEIEVLENDGEAAETESSGETPAEQPTEEVSEEKPVEETKPESLDEEPVKTEETVI